MSAGIIDENHPKRQPQTEFVLQQAPIETVNERLGHQFPDAKCALNHRNAFELLIATVLSAQTTDERVNAVTIELFERWPSPESLAAAEQSDVKRVIKPLGLAETKSERLLKLAEQLCREYGGEVPNDQAALEALPGVGRKTAHVVRGNAFGASLLTVDTHVGRLSHRLGFSHAKTPLAIERDVVALAEAAPKRINLTLLSHRLILHGRATCSARNPQCQSCVLQDICPQLL